MNSSDEQRAKKDAVTIGQIRKRIERERWEALHTDYLSVVEAMKQKIEAASHDPAELTRLREENERLKALCDGDTKISRQLERRCKELRLKADSFDALWSLCVELGMPVDPPGTLDEDGNPIEEESAYQFKFIRDLTAERDEARRQLAEADRELQTIEAIAFGGLMPDGWNLDGLAGRLRLALIERDRERAELAERAAKWDSIVGVLVEKLKEIPEVHTAARAEPGRE
jgi:hypothetical protein